MGEEIEVPVIGGRVSGGKQIPDGGGGLCGEGGGGPIPEEPSADGGGG